MVLAGTDSFLLSLSWLRDSELFMTARQRFSYYRVPWEHFLILLKKEVADA